MRNDHSVEPNTGASEPSDPLPVCRLIGTDGNVFAIIGKVRRTLREASQPERASAFAERAFQSRSYDEVLQLCLEYVDVQ